MRISFVLAKCLLRNHSYFSTVDVQVELALDHSHLNLNYSKCYLMLHSRLHQGSSTIQEFIGLYLAVPLANSVWGQHMVNSIVAFGKHCFNPRFDTLFQIDFVVEFPTTMHH